MWHIGFIALLSIVQIIAAKNTIGMATANRETKYE